MKQIPLILVVCVILASCTAGRHSAQSPVVQSSDGDSTQYEIVIMDLQFDHWYLVNYSPAKDLSVEIYSGKNRLAVANWNYYYQSGNYRNVIDCQINYEPGTNYGQEVERKLYWYFRYIEETYKIRLFN